MYVKGTTNYKYLQFRSKSRDLLCCRFPTLDDDLWTLASGVCGLPTHHNISTCIAFTKQTSKNINQKLPQSLLLWLLTELDDLPTLEDLEGDSRGTSEGGDVGTAPGGTVYCCISFCTPTLPTGLNETTTKASVQYTSTVHVLYMYTYLEMSCYLVLMEWRRSLSHQGVGNRWNGRLCSTKNCLKGADVKDKLIHCTVTHRSE